MKFHRKPVLIISSLIDNPETGPPRKALIAFLVLSTMAISPQQKITRLRPMLLTLIRAMQTLQIKS